MTVQSIKVKVQRRPSVKLKVLPRFPVDVLGSSPILIDRTGGAYRFSLDIDALSVSVLSAKPITGTSNEISVAHGDGSGGNPTISLPNALTFTGKTVTGGTFNDILSMTAHTAGASPTAIAGTATLAKFYAGSSGTPVTTETPTVSISRYDNSYITGSNYPSALLVETVGNNTVAGFGLAPQNAASFRATQNGAGDVLGVGVEVFGNSGGGYYAYGYYFAVHTATVGRAAYGIEGAMWNNAISTPYAKGATSVYFAAANFLAAGNYDTTAGIYFSRGGFGRKFDAGLVGGIDSIASALVWDDSSAVTSYKDTGTHTDGIDLTQATYSGSAIKSTGFSVSPTGVLAAATGSTVNGIAIVNLSATQTLTNKSISGSSNTLTNIPISSAISGLGTGVATALGVNIGSAGAFVTFNGALGTPSSATLTSATGLPVSTGISGLGTGIATALAVNVGTAGAPVINGGALGSPSSVGTLPAHTLGGTISGGGNQINNVVIGASTPLAGSFTTIGGTDITASGFLRAAGSSGLKMDGTVVLDAVSGFVRMKDMDGNQFFSAGNVASGVPYSYFDRDQHNFRNKSFPFSTFVRITSTGLDIQTGNLLVSSTKVVGARDTGWTAMTGTANKNTAYDTSTVTLAQLAGRVMSLQAALTTHGLIGA